MSASISSHLGGLIELLLVFGVVLVWAGREWWTNRKWLKEREAAKKDGEPPPAP
ncbi:hypothetical protein [Leptothrix discophora]|uniref:Uncharacterized protein n=1 Tax=Leptothrix discophora TaxID=89 RepID=A0ABT9G4K5_LEPDI|nr:hypothetical protein [Leptothrix discophora]MDP4301392.1 hypothetical protein [Leptothrix discophora]